MKKKKNISEIEMIIQSVEKLIDSKMMLVRAKNFHVVMLAELWNIYSDEQKVHFCQNVLNYCKINNVINHIEKKTDPVLLISIKYSADNVEPFAYFKNGEIELIKTKQ